MKKQILNGDLNKIIYKLTIPGYYGMLEINISNVIDKYFVSLLGTDELTAMSFTFPIIMIINFITIGIGIAISVLVAKK